MDSIVHVLVPIQPHEARYVVLFSLENSIWNSIAEFSDARTTQELWRFVTSLHLKMTESSSCRVWVYRTGGMYTDHPGSAHVSYIGVVQQYHDTQDIC